LNRWIVPLLDRLRTRRGRLHLALLTVALTWPALFVGWAVDDYYHRFCILRPPEFEAVIGSSPLTDLFRFFSPDKNLASIDLGIMPWWSVIDGRGAFLRPVTALTHVLDYRLWPTVSHLMHAQSLAWYLALVLAAAGLYRLLDGSTAVAALAALLYAIDDAHATPVAWLANRNATVAAFFGVVAIIAHVRWRQSGRWRFAALSPLLFAMALLAGESGIATFGYLAAYALCVEGGSALARVASIAPYTVVAIVWRLVWSAAGYGVDGIGLYVDPAADPIRFAFEAAWRAPCLIAPLTTAPSADLFTLIGAFLPLSVTIGAVLVATAVSVAAVALLWRAVRSDAVGRFYLAGMLLAVPPSCATFPSDRLLLFAGIGAFGCTARLIAMRWRLDHAARLATRARSDTPRAPAAAGGLKPAARSTAEPAHGPDSAPAPATYSGAASIMRRARADAPESPRLPRWLRLGAAVMVACHVVIAPIALLIRSAIPVGLPAWTESVQLLPPDDLDLTGKTVIVVNPPVALPIGYTTIRRATAGLSTPAHLRVLGASMAACTLTREDDRTVIVRPEGAYLLSPLDKLCRGPRHPLRTGEVIALTDVTIEIVSQTPDGRPAAARFRFNRPLEDPSLLWWAWIENAFVPFTPPPAGRSVHLPAAMP